MESLSPADEKQRGLSRERLVEAALEVVQEEGLEGLSMRALADRLEVKAASLYWHVRDRRELLELLADSILGGVGRPRQRATWRETVLAIAEVLGRRVSGPRDASRILLEVPESLPRSGTFAALAAQFSAAGLQAGEAADVALMVMTYVIAGRATVPEPEVHASSAAAPASIAIDSGSRGVILRAGTVDMQGLIRVPPEQSGAAPAVVRGEQVVVRRLRGVGRGEIELNPRRPWRFKVQAPTWNTVLDLGGLDVREVWVDSGAANLELFLPPPRGVVPIHVSSGGVNVSIKRARDAAVRAVVRTGTVKVKLDDYATKFTVQDLYWQSPGALEARDRYELDVSSGVVDLELSSYTPKVERELSPTEGPARAGKAVSALEVLLDGVQARVKP